MLGAAGLTRHRLEVGHHEAALRAKGAKVGGATSTLQQHAKHTPHTLNVSHCIHAGSITPPVGFR
jgi:hypothetical protein